MNWIKNNLITIVEILIVVADIAELAVNGIARIFLPTETVKKIHDGIKFADEWLVKIKGFLLVKAG